jgi:hypothetical protein
MLENEATPINQVHSCVSLYATPTRRGRGFWQGDYATVPASISSQNTRPSLHRFKKPLSQRFEVRFAHAS